MRIVGHVGFDGDHQAGEVGLHAGDLGAHLGVQVVGDRNRRKDGNDGYDDQELDQREASAPHLCFLLGLDRQDAGVNPLIETFR